MNKRKQGDIGVAVAVLHYSKQGIVSVPTTEGSRYDLIVDRGAGLERVQVKTAFSEKPNGNFEVQLRTNGANYTQKNKHRKISSEETDLVFVFDGQGRAWEFKSEELNGRSTVALSASRSDKIVGKYAGVV